MQEVKNIDLFSKILYETGSIKVGKFLLASGKSSSIYIDMRKLLGNIDAFKMTANLLSLRVNEINKNEELDVIAGVATGGIPWASIVAYLNSMPMAYVRQPKGHGTDSKIEGADVSGKRVLVVDDVSTTGGSIINSINIVKTQKGIVNSSIVIVDRGEGAIENLKKVGVNLYYLFSLRDILNSLVYQKLIDVNIYNNIIFELYGG
ncbi:MAG: orotate phosphoribosyltransferase [Caldisphaera sp.]|jgi:orotate phosphoribosyltransferase|uniref:orotate phosphoribosyltransferase n=1 Tax=Caldisphaera sp. TaxID=2060322 RepID=UPI00397E0F93